MRISDLLSMCVRNLARRKFRTFLTVMGVIIGTSFIVVMISLGIGIEQAQTQMLEAWGDLSMITIHNAGNTETILDSDAIAAIQAMPEVQIATPVVEMRLDNGSAMMYAGRGRRFEMGAWSVVGINYQALELLGYTVSEGELLVPAESGRGLRVMFGEMTAYQFRDTRRRWPNDFINVWDVPEGQERPDPFFDPLTETSLVLSLLYFGENAKSTDFNMDVVGIMDGNWVRGQETMFGVVMDLNDMQRIIAEYERANSIRRPRNEVQGYDTARVRCYSIDDVAQVEAALHAMGFTNTSSMEEIRQSMQEGAQQIQFILGLIGSIVLFVSALSIMNTMIMSVYERTREIGVMKVLGCTVGSIRAAFLIEAALIGFFGGVIGNILSYLASSLLNFYGAGAMGGGRGQAAAVSVIPPSLMLLGLVFATCVGLISGIIPAMRAVKISALEAIRTE